MLLLETRDDHASISGVLCFDEKRVLKGMERKGALYNIGMSSPFFFPLTLGIIVALAYSSLFISVCFSCFDLAWGLRK